MFHLISLLLKKFAYGFDYQKGAILALMKNMSDDTGIVLKLCDLDDEKINQLNQFQIHNLSEEGSDIFGKQNLKYVSCKIVLNNSADLIIKNSSDFKKYRKPAAEIKKLKFQWSQKTKVLEKSGFSQKEIIINDIERPKLDKKDFFRKQLHTGIFTTSKAVTYFLKNEAEGKEKKHRFERDTSQSFKK